ncbi:MAG: hypothetical protein IJF07_07860, partial [Lachnospiraceae bacterium]|nr:hypothetical protein [Lachnospiraceae bacterium]
MSNIMHKMSKKIAVALAILLFFNGIPTSGSMTVVEASNGSGVSSNEAVIYYDTNDTRNVENPSDNDLNKGISLLSVDNTVVDERLEQDALIFDSDKVYTYSELNNGKYVFNEATNSTGEEAVHYTVSVSEGDTNIGVNLDSREIDFSECDLSTPCKVWITAGKEGDENYKPAEPVSMSLIVSATTLNDFAFASMNGEIEYSDTWSQELPTLNGNVDNVNVLYSIIEGNDI